MYSRFADFRLESSISGQRAAGMGNENTGISAPQLSLPQGGGSVRGIDEKLITNLVTGSAGFNLSLPVSAARSGFSPQLALAYSTGMGNGLFGLGWGLSLPSIVRKTEQGLPQYDDAGESDVFIVAGAEDLVPVLRQNGETWSAFEEIHNEGGVNYRVKRYRPRIEGSFACIEQWKSLDDGIIHWRSMSGENITIVYGETKPSRIADPEHPNRIFEWLPSRSFDEKGNCILYFYKQEDGVGIDPARLHDEKRQTGQAPFTNRYLKRILYGPKTPSSGQKTNAPDCLFEIVFDYGEHDPLRPLPDDNGSWLARLDAFSSYRAGFEIRTYRLCQRVLVFHHFEELGSDPCLVRSLDFSYTQQSGISFLQQVIERGYVKQADGHYSSKSLPPLTLAYQQARWSSEIKTLSPQSLKNAPFGADEAHYLWLDLYSEGLPGIFTEESQGWYYKRNLGAGTLAPTTLVSAKPSFTGIDAGRVSILDLDADGQKQLVSHQSFARGYFPLTTLEGLQPEQFVPFEHVPTCGYSGNPNARLIDLTGDGRVDLLVSEDEIFCWYPSLGKQGYAPARAERKASNEERGPALLFADKTLSIFLADMNGDGLVDIVRIRNGEVVYWPSLGYGRFGAKVSMDNAPLLDHPDSFNPRLLRLADIDGSGTTDIIYLGKKGLRIYSNYNGNEFGEMQSIDPFPHLYNASSVSVVDLLGNGTGCIVWSSALPGDTDQPLCYIDLMDGKKPHLLTSYSNTMGKEVSIEYASSTDFYLADARAGTPWATKLPFPVQCVTAIETIDRISRTRFRNEYRYHHGFYDLSEREFRGFGRVDQLDSETFEHFVKHDAANVVEELLHQAPALTKSWFHTGAWFEQDRITNRYASEYYHNDQLTEDTLSEPLPVDLTTEEEREFARGHKGLLLRQEVYALDGSVRELYPYTVQQHSYQARVVQPKMDNLHAAVLITPCESLVYHYDRNPSDPRIIHTLVLKQDEFGNALQSAAVSYPRRIVVTDLPAEVQAAQSVIHITFAETDFTNDLDSHQPRPVYRLRLPYESRNYELTGITLSAGPYFSLGDLRTAITAAMPIDFEQSPDGTLQKRLLGRQRTLFLKNDLSGPLPAGQLESLALSYQSYSLAFTPGLLDQGYANRVDDVLLVTSGYVTDQANPIFWMIPSSTATYAADAPNHFYLPSGVRDALGQTLTMQHDRYDLLVTQTCDTLGNTNTASYDYRTLQAVQLTDPNQNRSAADTDELGMVIKSAVMGKEGAGEGDTLADPTARMEYSLSNWQEHGQPNFVHTFVREQHGADNPRLQESYAYYDGGGRVVMSKVQAKPGPALTIDERDWLVEVDTTPDVRWIGNGRTIVNNKGLPVKQYEPYFAVSPAYEDDRRLVEIGVTPILYYDPIGRLMRTEFPDGTLTRVEFDSWQQAIFDRNDTVLESRWYQERGSPRPADPEPSDPQVRAAWLAASQANTPLVTHFDALGRTVMVISDNGVDGKSSIRMEADLTAREQRVFDQKGRQVVYQLTNMVGAPIYEQSAEIGERRDLSDVLGRPVRTWDGTQRVFRYIFDDLNRPLQTFLTEGDGAEQVVGYHMYGEQHPDATALNLRGKIYQAFDQAGMLTLDHYDFKGNPLRIRRRLAKEYHTPISWQALTRQTGLSSIEDAANDLLEDEEFAVTMSVDALNRPIEMQQPDQSVIQFSYDPASFLNSLNVDLRGEGTFIPFLLDQQYNAKGQRLFATLGNSTTTSYSYDPLTFRLISALTTRASDSAPLQNLTYSYDPIGNITSLVDNAQQTHFFKNAVVKPEAKYVYDALYQLRQATGREHTGQGNDQPRSQDDLPFEMLPHANDAAAVRVYNETYSYDEMGNILQMRHSAGGVNWTRYYQYATDTNRLLSTSLPGDDPAGPAYSARYRSDEYGNMLQMPHLPSMSWDYMNQLRVVDLGGGGTAYYVYDGGGQRIRKVVERSSGLRQERIYLGAVEIYREYRAGKQTLERQTLHVSEGGKNLAQIDTKTLDADDPTRLNHPTICYQYGNYLGSAMLELDERAAIISYEEYHPFGTTSYYAGRSVAEASLKCYRFMGKERDEESGLYYHGARYYAPWLGRWTNSDPAGMVDGMNLYRFVRNNPINLTDPTGYQSKQPQSQPAKPTSTHPGYEDVDSIPIIQTGDGEGEVAPGYGLCVTPDRTFMCREVGTPTKRVATEGPPGLISSTAPLGIPVRRQQGPPASGPASLSMGPKSMISYQGGTGTGIQPEKEEEEEGFWESEPGTWTSLIPFYGSGREVIHHILKGNPVRAIFWGLLTVSDIFLLKSLAVGAVKVGGTLLAKEVAQVAAKEKAAAAAAHFTGEAIAKSGATWKQLGGFPKIEMAQVGEWFVKRIKPGSGKIMTLWGKSSLEAQEKGLQLLGDMATPHFMENGMMFTKGVGETLPWYRGWTAMKTYWEGSKRMGTYLNDIRPRNMGINGLIFDPAWDEVVKTVYVGGILPTVVKGYAGFGDWMGWIPD